MPIGRFLVKRCLADAIRPNLKPIFVKFEDALINTANIERRFSSILVRHLVGCFSFAVSKSVQLTRRQKRAFMSVHASSQTVFDAVQGFLASFDRTSLFALLYSLPSVSIMGHLFLFLGLLNDNWFLNNDCGRVGLPRLWQLAATHAISDVRD